MEFSDYSSDPSNTPDTPFGTGTSDELSPNDLRFINFLSNQGKKDSSENPFSIPREAWKLMIKAYGKDISKFLDARKEAERAQKDPKSDSVPRANSNQPPILRKKQYDSLPADVKALLVEQICVEDDDNDDTPSENLDESSVDSSPDTDRKTMAVLSDTDRQILQTLQGLYSPDRHINMARSENSTTVINTTS